MTSNPSNCITINILSSDEEDTAADNYQQLEKNGAIFEYQKQEKNGALDKHQQPEKNGTVGKQQQPERNGALYQHQQLEKNGVLEKPSQQEIDPLTRRVSVLEGRVLRMERIIQHQNKLLGELIREKRPFPKDDDDEKPPTNFSNGNKRLCRHSPQEQLSIQASQASSGIAASASPSILSSMGNKPGNRTSGTPEYNEWKGNQGFTAPVCNESSVNRRSVSPEYDEWTGDRRSVSPEYDEWTGDRVSPTPEGYESIGRPCSATPDSNASTVRRRSPTPDGDESTENQRSTTPESIESTGRRSSATPDSITSHRRSLTPGDYESKRVKRSPTLDGYESTGVRKSPTLDGYESTGVGRSPPLDGHESTGVRRSPFVDGYESTGVRRSPRLDGHESTGVRRSPFVDGYELTGVRRSPTLDGCELTGVRRSSTPERVGVVIPAPDVVAVEEVPVPLEQEVTGNHVREPRRQQDEPQLKETVYVEVPDLTTWKRGRIVRIQRALHQPTQFEVEVSAASKVLVPGWKLAFLKSPGLEEPLAVGSRVIVNLDGDFCDGLVLKPPKPENNNRYQVFLGDKGFRHADRKQIRKIFADQQHSCQMYRELVETYFNRFPVDEAAFQENDRSVCGVPTGGATGGSVIPSTMSTSLPRDGSLSTSAMNISDNTNANDSFGSYDSDSFSAAGCVPLSVSLEILSTNEAPAKRMVARKSTWGKRYVGAQKYYPVDDIRFPQTKPKRRVKHEKCTYAACIGWVPDPGEVGSKSPLVYPLFRGWARRVIKKTGKVVRYTTPCGEVCKNMENIRWYLREVQSDMTVDMFDFHVETRPFARLIFEQCFILNQDLSEGKESLPITVFNDIDDSRPEKFRYWTDYAGRIPEDPKRLVRCDCRDDCRNEKRTCACHALTLEEWRKHQALRPVSPDYVKKPEKKEENATYSYRRLHMRNTSGVYECNPLCKCAPSCLNRVAQNPLSLELQVFKTKNRGWGVRCLHDIPLGAFICTYTGELLNDKEAEKIGKIHGADYFLALDLKKTVGTEIDGFESGSDADVEENSQEQELEELSLDKETGEGYGSLDILDVPSPATLKSKLNQRGTFVVDGKRKGNVSRFFNHSCEPNLFVQNIFTDNYDPRLHKVAFFAANYIPAGCELTWDYGYTCNASGKTMECLCGSSKCVGKLF